MKVEDNIRKHGWHATAVSSGEETPPFVYTTGLGATFSHPEVIVFGLDAVLAHGLLSDVVADLRSGKSYAKAGRYADLFNVPVELRSVHPSQCIMYFADTLGFYRAAGAPLGFTAVQLFWPDRDGRFPFDSRCDPGVLQAQPRLDLALLPSELDAFLQRYS